MKLRIGHADGRVEERELGPGSYRIGREAADIVLPHGSVSAHHAQLEVTSEQVVIRDTGSRNGTFAPNGQRLTAAYTLVPEQSIRLGAIPLTLLRSIGQAGGTSAMAEVPAPGRTRVMAEVPPPVVFPAHGPSGPTRRPPRTSRWLKWLGVGVLVLLGFVSWETCTALVQTLSTGTPSSGTPSTGTPSTGTPAGGTPSKTAGKHPPSKRR